MSTTQNTYQVESFTTGSRQAVHAADLMAALDITAGDNFIVAQAPDGRFIAVSNENSAFIVPGQHWGDTPEAAAASLKEHYNAIHATKKPHTSKAPCQPPVNAPQCCVLYVEDGKEQRTAWMSRERAQRALAIMKAKHGDKNAIIYVD